MWRFFVAWNEQLVLCGLDRASLHSRLINNPFYRLDLEDAASFCVRGLAACDVQSYVSSACIL